MSASSSTAYLLVAHGSRDPRPQAAMNRLAQLVRDQLQAWTSSNFSDGQLGGERSVHHGPLTATRGDLSFSAGIDLPIAPPPLANPLLAHPSMAHPPVAHPPLANPSAIGKEGGRYPIVGTAYLELAPLPLHQQLLEFCLRAKATGVEQVKVIPIFLLRGVHVVADIPAEVALAQEQLAGRMKVDLCPHLGSHPHLARLLKARLADAASEKCLLLAHGSRQPGGNRSVETLAKALGASLAFWSVSPTLETQVVQLMQSGCQRLTILPYFLFAGGITDAITHMTEELAERFPRISFRLLPPLGATTEIARLTTEIALNCSPQGTIVKPMKRVALRH